MNRRSGLDSDEDDTGSGADVINTDFSTHTVKYLTDKDFVENVGFALSRSEGSEEGRASHSADDAFQSLFSQDKHHGTMYSAGHRPGSRGARLTEDDKSLIEGLLKDCSRPSEDYKTYHSWDHSSEAFKFLMEVLGEHLCVVPRDLHKVLHLLETVVFDLVPEEVTISHTRQLRNFRNLCFAEEM